MKLALGPLGLMLVGAATIAFGAGCGTSASQRGPAIGTTEVSSVTFTLSRLAPAAWDADELAPAEQPPAQRQTQTWGSAASAPSARAPAAAPELAKGP